MTRDGRDLGGGSCKLVNSASRGCLRHAGRSRSDDKELRMERRLVVE